MSTIKSSFCLAEFRQSTTTVRWISPVMERKLVFGNNCNSIKIQLRFNWPNETFKLLPDSQQLSPIERFNELRPPNRLFLKLNVANGYDYNDSFIANCWKYAPYDLIYILFFSSSTTLLSYQIGEQLCALQLDVWLNNRPIFSLSLCSPESVVKTHCVLFKFSWPINYVTGKSAKVLLRTAFHLFLI